MQFFQPATQNPARQKTIKNLHPIIIRDLLVERGSVSMITRVRLKNWKSHLDSDMRFSSGVNVLIGVMGSGKSSLVEGISFALFGTFPGLKSRRLELDHLIMKKPEQKQRCQVELEFTADDMNYYIKRVIDKGKGTGHAEIRRDGQVLNVNARGVTDEVVRALKMDYDLFSKAVYSEQNGLDYFLRIPKGSRKKEIDRMLKVDRFEKARTGAVAMRGKVKTRNEERSRLLSDMQNEGLPEKMDATKAELGKLQKELDVLGIDIKKVDDEAVRLSGRLAEAEGVEKELNKARADLQGAKSGLEEASQSSEMLEKRFKGRSTDDIEEDIKAKEIESALKKKEVEAIEKEVGARRTELASINSMIRISAEAIEGLRKAEAKCPVCDSDMPESRKSGLIEKRRQEEGECREKAKSVAEGIAEISKRKVGVDEDRKKLELEVEKLKSAKDEFSELGRLIKRKQEHEKRKQELEVRTGQLEKRMEDAGLDALRQKSSDLAAKQSSIKEKMSGIQDRISDKELVLNDLKERKATMERYGREAGRDADIVKQLDIFEKVLKVTQDQLREEFLKTVNGIMADVWAELYPYADYQDIRMAIEDDYVLQLKEPDGWVSVEGTVSGGERSMATLTLRVAFSMAFLPNLRWLMLDEPTHNLDSNAIKQFASILREKMDMFAEQVFLITHEERISEGVTGNLYRMERDKDNNKPTVIRPL
jgi:exonuclease SbcC